MAKTCLFSHVNAAQGEVLLLFFGLKFMVICIQRTFSFAFMFFFCLEIIKSTSDSIDIYMPSVISKMAKRQTKRRAWGRKEKFAVEVLSLSM
jgi:hypothetical protein